MKRVIVAAAVLALGIGQAAGETVLEHAARMLTGPGTEAGPSGITVHYTILIPEPWAAYHIWPYGRAYAYPCPAYPPPYPPPGSYWYAQVPLTPGLVTGPRAYPSAVYIYPSFQSGWAYGPTYIPSAGQVAPWAARPPSAGRRERAEEGPKPGRPGSDSRGQEPQRPVVIQTAQTSEAPDARAEDISFLPLKRVALETSPSHPGLEVEAIGSGQVKVTLSLEGDSELESVEIALVSKQGKALDSAAFSKPPYSATLRGDWREARLRLALRFKGGGLAQFLLPLKEKEAHLKEAAD